MRLISAGSQAVHGLAPAIEKTADVCAVRFSLVLRVLQLNCFEVLPDHHSPICRRG
jgi:hypothetical protein